MKTPWKRASLEVVERVERVDGGEEKERRERKERDATVHSMRDFPRALREDVCEYFQVCGDNVHASIW